MTWKTKSTSLIRFCQTWNYCSLDLFKRQIKIENLQCLLFFPFSAYHLEKNMPVFFSISKLFMLNYVYIKRFNITCTCLLRLNISSWSLYTRSVRLSSRCSKTFICSCWWWSYIRNEYMYNDFFSLIFPHWKVHLLTRCALQYSILWYKKWKDAHTLRSASFKSFVTFSNLALRSFCISSDCLLNFCVISSRNLQSKWSVKWVL